MDGSRTSDDHRWTNERHLHFLKSIEASFVRTMLENGDAGVFLPMNRYLPDSCESTLDSKTPTPTPTKKRKNHFLADNWIDRRARIHPSSPLQDDQVVPHIKHIKIEDNDNSWTNSS